MVQSAYGNALKLIDEYRLAIDRSDEPVVSEMIRRWCDAGLEAAREWYLRLLDCYDALIIAGFHDHPVVPFGIMDMLEIYMEETWYATDFEHGCPELKERAIKRHAAMKART